MKTIKLVMPLLISVFLLAACLSVHGMQSLPTGISDQDEWQTYTSTKYQFTIQLPTTWQTIEMPTAEYPTANDQVWFVSETLPPPQTDARADIVLIFTHGGSFLRLGSRSTSMITSQTLSSWGIYRQGRYQASIKRANPLSWLCLQKLEITTYKLCQTMVRRPLNISIR